MVRISFCIPAYNAENSLQQCLDSIKKQNVEKEVIVIDDGSTDETKNICIKNKVKYIRIKHSGASTARNIGMAEAKGEFIVLIDADTYISENWAASILKNDFENNDIIVTYSEVPLELKSYILQRYSTDHYMNLNKFDSVANGAIFKQSKKHLMQFDPLFIVGGEDNDVILRALASGAKVFVDTKNFYKHYHIHKNQTKRILRHIKKRFYFSYGDNLVIIRHWNSSKAVRTKLKDTWYFLPFFPAFYFYKQLTKKNNYRELILEKIEA